MTAIPDILKHFAYLIKEELGIVYAEHNFYQLQNRLEEVAKVYNNGSLEELYKSAHPRLTGPVKTLLMDLATNNETLFFRDQKIFSAMEHHILPAFVNAGGRDFRVWSAACSSGQEPISTAITLDEWSERIKRPLNYSILATDISERILQKAQKAEYTALEVSRGLTPAHLQKYFTKVDDLHFRARETFKQKIEFKKLNLKDPMPFAQNFDMILCRNVLIYQPVEGKREILSRLVQKLNPGGFLILGAGESLIGLSDDFNQVQCQGAIIYERKGSVRSAA